MDSIWTILLAVGGSVFATWATIKYLLIAEMRIDANIFKTLYKYGKSCNRVLVITEDFILENKYPLDFKAFFNLPGCPWFILTHSERLLTAGWQSKDYISKVTTLRWRQKRIRKFFEKELSKIQLKELGIPVEIITPYHLDKIGSLKMAAPTPILDKSIYEDFEKEIAEVLDGKLPKTGALFYGTPGNGKTMLVKYLALKYQLPIRLVTFSPEFSNIDLMLMFSQITPRSIILFEDFDNYFDGRNCIMGQSNSGNNNMSIKFTFDAILNGLDGVYNTYKESIFIMTVNDLDKVDGAIKYRPSRFKFLKKIDSPSYVIRNKLLPVEWAVATDGFNLDQVFAMRKFQQQGTNLMEALVKVVPNKGVEYVRELAKKRYEERVKLDINGSSEDDWLYAKTKLGVNGEVV